MAHSPLRIGFVSTRIAGTDGVSLEIQKWDDVLSGLGHECFYFAGLSDRSVFTSLDYLTDLRTSAMLYLRLTFTIQTF
jgi:hypothetical protein